MSTRSGTWIVAAALLLWGGVAATPELLLAGEANARPPGTVASEGFPPYVPDDADDDAAVRAWCDACVEAARAHETGQFAGDLLYAAAFALHRRLRAASDALALYEEAAQRYPPAAPGAALAHLESAVLYLRTADPAAAARALSAARSIGRAPSPLDATPRELAHWDFLQEQLTWTAPRVAADVAEAIGDLERAAHEMETVARAAEHARRDARWTAARYANAARLRARAGKTAAALAHVDRALGLTDDESQRAQLSLWRLYLRHGMLDERGASTLVRAWPGEVFVRDAYGVLRDLHGNAHVGPHVLSLASRAWTSGDDAAALAFYEIALADPVLCEQARTDPSIARGLLAAFPVALRLGRLDRAETILETVAGLVHLPREELAGYRLAILEAREQVAKKGEVRPANLPATSEASPALPEAPDTPEAPEAPEAPDARPHRGRLRPATPDAPPDRGPNDVDTVRRGIGQATGALAALAVLLVLVVGLIRKGWRR